MRESLSRYSPRRRHRASAQSETTHHGGKESVEIAEQLRYGSPTIEQPDVASDYRTGQFGTDETPVNDDDVLAYLRTHTTGVGLNEVVARWRGDLVEYGLDQLSDDSTDPND